MNKKHEEEQNQPQEATKTYFLPEYGLSIEATTLNQAVSLAKDQQKGSEQSEN